MSELPPTASSRFRRGPWEMLASILIALGVVMLMQPFASVALHLFLHRHADRHGDVHHRQPFPE